MGSVFRFTIPTWQLLYLQSHLQLDIKLDGINYCDWAISIEMFDSLDLLAYIDDSVSIDEKKVVD